MRITVKIDTIEISIDRPKFREGATEDQDKYNMRSTVMPCLEEVIKKAKELYELRNKVNNT